MVALTVSQHNEMPEEYSALTELLIEHAFMKY